MIVYFSARILQPQESGGIVNYYLGLVQAFAKMPGVEIHTGLMPLNFRELGDQLPANVTRHRITCLTPDFWVQKEREILATLRPDWVIYPYPDLVDTYRADSGFKTAVCIPDLQHLAHPYFFPAGARMNRDEAIGKALGSADLIFTLSEHVKAEIVRIYDCDERLVRIIHPAVSQLFLDGPASSAEVNTVLKKYGIPKRYAIFPGNFWQHKNHRTLLQALALLRSRGVNLPLVLVGSRSTTDGKLLEQIARARSEGWLFLPGYVPGDDLHALISGATCLLFPSLFEGFGIPVAEALSVGVPVACSNLCSLPEVGGDVARYFDPNDAESIAAVVEDVWKNKPDDFATRARAQALRFRYEHSAAELLQAIKSTPERSDAPGYQRIAANPIPLVSIVTPWFQHAQFLRECIESVLTQDYPHIEYMVLDGGSTDGTREILESYGDRFFWSSAPDGGQTAAINTGLRRAKGDILAYLNSDDILLPGAISRAVEAWRDRPSVDVFYGRANMIDENGKFLREYETREFNLSEFKGHCYICQPAAFWTRRIMEHVGIMDENFHTAMDYEYWQRVAAKDGLILRLDALQACSRDYNTTKTRSQRGKVFNDVIKSQWLHWGRVHPLWWRGWLDYMKMEKPGLHARFIPPAKKSEGLSKFLSRTARKWQPSRLFNTARLSVLALRIRNFRESGYFTDGWAGTAFRMPLNVTQSSRIHLEGVCPERKQIRIVLDGHKVRTIDVEAGASFHYEQELPPGRRMLRIYTKPTFSQGDPRPLGFYIHATNLFSFR